MDEPNIFPGSSPTPPHIAATLMEAGAVLTDVAGERFGEETVRDQWVQVSGAALRRISSDPAVRQALLPFCTQPVSETLPAQMLAALPQDGEADATDTSLLREYIALPEVPDERIVPDLITASPLLRPRGGLFDSPGKGTISEAEYRLVRDRYTMAREVKLLALGAELAEEGVPSLDEHGGATLPSGIVIQVDPDHSTEALALLNPVNWRSREKMKDRVHKIGINGKQYVMKEQKTDRHTDTAAEKDPTEPDTDSAHEFEVAKEFAAFSGTERDGYLLSWERPLGYVTYPDGFQFVVFEHEEGLLDAGSAAHELASTILANPEAYAEEFRTTSAACETFKQYRAVERADEAGKPHSIVGSLARLAMQRVGLGPKKLAERRLTFEEFAYAKACQTVDQGFAAHQAELVSRGYIDPDSDGVLYRLPGGGTQVEVVGFDFERYFKPDAESMTKFQDYTRDDRELRHRGRLAGHRFDGVDDVIRDNPMELAAFFALLEAHDSSLAAVREYPEAEPMPIVGYR